MEENKRFSWLELFIKVVLAIVFVLFAVWLVSLSNKEISNSLDVLTDDIFAKNIARMKEVGKEYFTTERLPQKVGKIETLTLKEMYEKKLILEIKNKNGKACDANNSYVSIEKLENEYQMKVYLSCDDKEDYIIVIMGCYDYCDSDICEKKEDTVTKDIEYEYKKTTGGYWTDYGSWSDWSKIEVTGTNYRQIDTKIVDETYTYDKIVTEILYDSFDENCPSGYSKTSDGTKCYKKVTKYTSIDESCPSGYSKTSDGTKCYKKVTKYTSIDESCPSGYSKTSDGTKCYKYSYKNPNSCSSTYNGYTLVSQDGFTCNYSKSSTYTATPSCPSTYNGYTYYGIDGLTCKYSKQVVASIDYVYSCDDTCSMKPVYTYKYEYTTSVASCPSGTVASNNSCVGKTTSSTTTEVSCPTGYNKTSDGTKCYKTNNIELEKSCPTGYSMTSDGTKCYKVTYDYKELVKSCPAGYSMTSDGTKCYKVTYDYKELVKSCKTGYSMTSDGTKCYKEVSSVIKDTTTRKVTYYRYRLREYVGGTTDYKWSSSKNDTTLINAGYSLTGKTR